MFKLFAELKRRNVFRVAGAYAVIAWLLAQMAGVLEQSLNLPTWFDTMIVSCLLLGFPVSLIFAWAFEMTPEGVKRTQGASTDHTNGKSSRSLDYGIIGGLIVVATLIVGDRIFPEKPTANTVVSAESADVTEALQSKSIAVLPFEDFSPAKDQAYFADGIAEELLNVLARVNGLRVASRTSAFSFKQREASVGEIAKALNVRHILEGSVRKAGKTLRITAQLIDTSSDEHLWSETYDRPLTAENIFEIQDEISQAIVLELHGRLDLLPSDTTRPTQSAEAYEAYLRGKAAYSARTPAGIENSITEYIRATTLDANFAVAHSKLAFAYMLANSYDVLPEKVATERGRIHIDRALELSPGHWEVLSDHAWFQADITDISETAKLKAFDSAITANPNNSEAHRGKGVYLENLGRFQEARKSLNKARVLDPRSAITLRGLASIAQSEGKLDELIALSKEILKLEPGYINTYNLLANAYSSKGQLVLAHQVLKQCGDFPECMESLANLYAEIKLLDQVRQISPLKADYFSALEDARYDEVIRLAPVVFANEPISLLIAYLLANRLDLAEKFVQDHPKAFQMFLNSDRFNGVNFAIMQTSLLAIFENSGDARAENLRSSLEKTFANVGPRGHDANHIYLAGAQWKLMNNDYDGAMAWLNGLAERGIPFTMIEYITNFESLKSRKDFQDFEARMKSLTKKSRDDIKAQLADPPEIWWPNN